MIVEDLIEINRRIFYDLWNVSCFNEKPSGLSPRLIFPKKRKKVKNEDVKRISEQEARILYCNILNNFNYFYSIETPTEKTYQQTGVKKLSALSDLSIYIFSKDEFKKKANVEFKAHNPTTKNISKDIEKIIKEGLDGNWFHILKNIDKGTLPSLFDKFIQNSAGVKVSKIKKISIVFSFCILEKKLGIIKHFKYDSSSRKNITEFTEEFFCLSKISDSNNIKDKNVLKQKDILKNNGWTIIET